MPTKLRLVHSGDLERKALLDEVFNEVFHRMPFGQEFCLADGRPCRIVKMSLPHDLSDGEDNILYFLFAVFVNNEDEEPEMIRMSVWVWADHEDDEGGRDSIADTKGNA